MAKKYDSYVHAHHFYNRIVRSVITGIFAISIALFIGMVGYHYSESMSWLDSFVNASMILSGMGEIGALNTPTGKFFAGCYALFSGLFFVIMIAVIFSPFIHRFLYKVHSDFHEK